MVSIIIPVYNRAQYIKDCLDSVLNQTYKDSEIILIDDGSTDNLKDVLVPYINKIQYIYKRNGGAASARNVGIKHAKGDYIAFLDSDDSWLNFKLELQIKILETITGIGLVFTDFSCVHLKRRNTINSYIREYFHELPTYDVDYCTMFTEKSSLEELNINTVEKNTMVYWGDISDKTLLGPMFPTLTVVVRKRCIEDTGFFDEKYKTAEDFDFFARIAKKYNVAYIDLSTANYLRGHDDQLSSSERQIETYSAWVDIVIKLWVKDEEYYRNHKRYVDWRLSHYCYSLGCAYYREEKYSEALHIFLKSLKINYKQRKIYLYTAISAFKTMMHSLINLSFKRCTRNG